MSYRDELIRAYTQHYEALRALVERRVQSPELAADIVQDCYLRIAEHDPAVAIDNPLAWLHRIVGNLVIDRLRQNAMRARYTDPEALDENLPDRSPGSEAIVSGQQRLQLLARAVGELPPRCREVFVLRKIEQLGFDDIAARMGISRNMVEKHLRKALQHCQMRLEQDGGVLFSEDGSS